MSASDGCEAMRSQLFFGAAAEQVWAANQHPGWQPGAMRPEDRERLVRIGLDIVMGERSGAFFVRCAPDESIQIGDEPHTFGFPSDVMLGTDPSTVMAHDGEWLVDELCETKVASGKQLPVCPIHPGPHPMDVEVTNARITASCPVAGMEVRSASF